MIMTMFCPFQQAMWAQGHSDLPVGRMKRLPGVDNCNQTSERVCWRTDKKKAKRDGARKE